MAINAYEIIKRPLLTEKTTYAMNEQKRYCFEVAMKSSKPEIKQSIETIYNVKVARVWTSIKKFENKQLKYGLQKGVEMKKATVTLQGDASIELF